MYSNTSFTEPQYIAKISKWLNDAKTRIEEAKTRLDNQTSLEE